MANFYRFAEEAIEKAGRVGERKRKKTREHELQIQARGHEQEVRLADIAAATAAATRAGEAEQKRLSWIRGTGELGVARERERGALERRGLVERGLEARHLRQFGPEGTEIKTAGMRLSDVMRGREEKKGRAIYEAEIERHLTPFVVGEGAEAKLPKWADIMRIEANVAEARRPGAGVELLRKGIAEQQEQEKAEYERYLKMTPEVFSEMERDLTERLSVGAY